MRTAGRRVIRFIETFLTLGGSFLGQPFLLMDWQKEVIRDIYLVDDEGKRLRRTYVLGVPRKNGKSQLGAALALFHLVADTADEAPVIISAAGDRAQARLVFDEARRMVLSSPELDARQGGPLRVYRNEIRNERNGGIYKAVSADAGLQQGLNPSMVIFDELHVFKNAELYEALTLGSAARREPLFVIISTAGYDLDSPLGRLYTYGLRVDGHRLNGERRPGEVEDLAFGMTWYGPEPGQDLDPADPKNWQRFNPSWAMLNEGEFATTYRTTHESAFIRYRLNGWTSSESAFLPHGAWDVLGEDGQEIPPGSRVVLMLDGSWKGDSTGIVAVDVDTLHVQVLGHWESPPNDPDWRVPIASVKEVVRLAFSHYQVVEFTADPYRWEQTLQEWADEGLPVVEFPTNSVARMTPATQAFYDAVMESVLAVKDGNEPLLTHDGHPALARHLANAVLKEDARGARLTKEYRSSRRFIDLAVCVVVGVHRALAFRESTPEPEPQLIVL